MPLSRMLLTTDAVGGVWRYSVDLAHALAARGVTPVLAVLGPPPDSALAAEAGGIELLRTGLPLDWTAPDEAALGRVANRLAAAAALCGARSAHLHAPALVGDAPWPVPVVAVGHSCLGTWWRTMGEGPLPPDFAWRIRATATGLRRADAVLAPSHAQAAAMRAVYGPLPVEVVANGLPAAPPGAPAALRPRAVLTAGRLWDAAKGCAALDAAAAVLDAPVLAAGPLAGPNGEQASFRHLRPLGTLDRAGMRAARAGARVFCSMARYEPFGLAVLEAAAEGMRLVLADTPVFRELWGGCARFIADPAELAPALSAALDAPADSEEERRTARAVARAGSFTLDRMAEATLAVHRRLGAGQGRAA